MTLHTAEKNRCLGLCELGYLLTCGSQILVVSSENTPIKTSDTFVNCLNKRNNIFGKQTVCLVTKLKIN